MIKINDTIIRQEQFGDGTLKCESFGDIRESNEIWWLYDGDFELFSLYSLVRDIQNRAPLSVNYLYMPYIPHARQDRNVSGRLFTLKYFAEIINSLNFHHVMALDPHSDVSGALINRLTPMIESELNAHTYLADAIMYPDAGAAKKYQKTKLPTIIGNKHRNEDGRIDAYELLGFQDGVKRVLIRDDICSYGGTFVAAAKALKERGVKKIHLEVSHCENNILKGEVFDYVDSVITTDSICTIKHPKINFVTNYRK